ncbi:hypothetical protein QBC39DRAFT_353629 [Podospora conica]|nr:hypothetical protein QBC39DRAFT_353629 [Schizothecium conicum]
MPPLSQHVSRQFTVAFNSLPMGLTGRQPYRAPTFVPSATLSNQPLPLLDRTSSQASGQRRPTRQMAAAAPPPPPCDRPPCDCPPGDRHPGDRRQDNRHSDDFPEREKYCAGCRRTLPVDQFVRPSIAGSWTVQPPCPCRRSTARRSTLASATTSAPAREGVSSAPSWTRTRLIMGTRTRSPLLGTRALSSIMNAHRPHISRGLAFPHLSTGHT